MPEFQLIMADPLRRDKMAWAMGEMAVSQDRAFLERALARVDEEGRTVTCTYPITVDAMREARLDVQAVAWLEQSDQLREEADRQVFETICQAADAPWTEDAVQVRVSAPTSPDGTITTANGTVYGPGLIARSYRIVAQFARLYEFVHGRACRPQSSEPELRGPDDARISDPAGPCPSSRRSL